MRWRCHRPTTNRNLGQDGRAAEASRSRGRSRDACLPSLEAKEAGTTQFSHSPNALLATALALTLALASRPAAHAQGAPEKHVVQAGDTLTSIAAMAGISVDRIVELNGLESPDTIFAGDTLLLADPVPARIVHRVEAGETLSSISRRFAVEVGALASLNAIEDPNQIAAGAELIIPDPPSASVASARAPEPTPTPHPTATPTATPRPATPTPAAIRTAVVQTPVPQTSSRGTYVVQGGDTIYSIARKLNDTPAAIVSANRLASADHIFVGQRLTIPGRSTSQAASTSQPVPPNDVVAVARQYLRAPYLFGGTTPDGFDCSGFIYFVFNRVGRAIERDIWSQYDSGPHVAREQLQPGDLVFFQNTYLPGLSHNGIYVGNGEFVNAVDEESGVAVSKLGSPYWAERWYGATRPRTR